MPAAITVNLKAFKEALQATTEELHRATRPAAQAGAQIIYDRARQHAPVSKRAHMFNIEGRIYGPFSPGNLRDSIYQVFSKSKSFKDVSTYEISWNKDKAPYGFVVERGTSKLAANSFIARSVVETRAEVREAMKARYIQEVKK